MLRRVGNRTFRPFDVSLPGRFVHYSGQSFPPVTFAVSSQINCNTQHQIHSISCRPTTFLTRDAYVKLCIARTMPSQDVCPSVHLSHAGSLLCRKRHSCFSTTNVMGWQYSDWYPLTGASNAGDRMKNRDVRTIALFRK